jgi:hypothetical protein
MRLDATSRVVRIGCGVALGMLLLAAAPANAQQLIACAANKDGSLRLVTSPGDCRLGKETAVSWSVVGPEGPQGEQGEPGFDGSPGLKGHRGRRCESSTRWATRLGC